MKFITMNSVCNKPSYLWSNIFYIKWKYGTLITNTHRHECLNYICLSQPNAELVSLVYMLKELIDTYDCFKVIPNITNTHRHECLYYICLSQPNADLVSLVYMLKELIDTYNCFKVIPNLCKNKTI